MENNWNFLDFDFEDISDTYITNVLNSDPSEDIDHLQPTLPICSTQNTDHFQLATDVYTNHDEGKEDLEALPAGHIIQELNSISVLSQQSVPTSSALFTYHLNQFQKMPLPEENHSQMYFNPPNTPMSSSIDSDNGDEVPNEIQDYKQLNTDNAIENISWFKSNLSAMNANQFPEDVNNNWQVFPMYLNDVSNTATMAETGSQQQFQELKKFNMDAAFPVSSAVPTAMSPKPSCLMFPSPCSPGIMLEQTEENEKEKSQRKKIKKGDWVKLNFKERLDIKRERNRIAAKKCREKKMSTIKTLEMRKKDLNLEIDRSDCLLRQKKSLLMNLQLFLLNHHFSNHCNIPNNPQSF